MTTNRPGKESWIEYYQQVHSSGVTFLDHSNPRAQAQFYSVAIDGAGPIEGKRCLDSGCGRGQFTLVLEALQASQVVGFDIVSETMTSLRERYPRVQWEVGSPEDEGFCRSLGLFDLVFAVEMLQLVDWRKALHNLWQCTRPGGRVVVVVPNRDNAIVQKTIARFSGAYVAPTPAELSMFATELPGLEFWAYRGMEFGDDQRIVPYVISHWSTSVDQDATPNRLAVVFQKHADTTMK